MVPKGAGQLSREEQLFWGAIVREKLSGGNCPGSNYPGGAIVPEPRKYCHDSNPTRQLPAKS